MRLDRWKDDYPLAEMLANMAGLEFVDGYYGRFVGHVSKDRAEEIFKKAEEILQKVRAEWDVDLELHVSGEDELWIVIDPGELERHGYVDEGRVQSKINRLWADYAEAVENDGYEPSVRRFYEEYSDEIDEYVADNIYLSGDVEDAFAVVEEEVKKLLKDGPRLRR